MDHPDFCLRVEGVYIGDEKYASSPREEIRLTLEGIKEDRHYGYVKKAGGREKHFYNPDTEIRQNRQWSAVSVEDLAVVTKAMGLNQPLKAEWLGANLLFSGYVDLTQLPVMTKLVFPGGAVFRIYEKNTPCIWPSKVMVEKDPTISEERAARFIKSALNHRGLVGWIECAGNGIIKPGDMVKVYLP